ncbi:esterase/lipase family protein [Nostoc sp. UHCC 0252]|uniref:esterase/lipase family protein n=1 Tax=Nostoc sp. UHCC 0252 TaxID=3110241 RepID=UPI002B22068C|nr:alpha/beta fold hydrolase [Nostoc sp. UHCC 0252]MEA5603814.1 alpha/beta fold hydrolase [Nostoc sp. UHCC 0252]
MKKFFSIYKGQGKRLWSKTKLLATVGITLVSVNTLCLTLSNRSSTASETTNSSSSGDFLKTAGIPPLGANNPACRPDAAHPQPIILVHATATVMAQDWSVLSPALAAKGYCVYALNYGNRATGPIEDSAQELAVFVDNVLALTGAQKVSIIGHSQGGMMPRYYIKFLGGVNKVDDLIALAPSNHGTTADELRFLCARVNFPLIGPACDQQVTGSAFMTKLNQDDETPAPVSYTVVTTRYDEIVIPYTSAFLNGPSERVTNITLQDYYPLDITGHVAISYDLNAFKFVFDALAHPGPAAVNNR